MPLRRRTRRALLTRFPITALECGLYVEAADYHGGKVHLLVLASASLAGAVVAVVLAVRALLALRRKRGWRRTAVLLACSGAVSLYVWGMLHVLGAVMQAEDGGTDSFPLVPCREAGDQIASQVVGYDVGYVGLSFDCRLSDGGRYTTLTRSRPIVSAR